MDVEKVENSVENSFYGAAASTFCPRPPQSLRLYSFNFPEFLYILHNYVNVNEKPERIEKMFESRINAGFFSSCIVMLF
jgi:hypothetical protein